MPGERSEATRVKRGRDGIPLAPALQRGLAQWRTSWDLQC
jgi:hypothetical protein